MDTQSIGLLSVAFMPDGRSIAAAGYGDNDIRIWDLSQLGRDHETWEPKHSSSTPLGASRINDTVANLRQAENGVYDWQSYRSAQGMTTGDSPPPPRPSCKKRGETAPRSRSAESGSRLGWVEGRMWDNWIDSSV